MFPTASNGIDTSDATVFMQNRALLSQLQGNPAMAFANNGGIKSQQPAPTMLRPMPKTLPPGAYTGAPFMTAGLQQNASSQQPQLQRPAVGAPTNQAALMQAMLMQQQMQQQQQQLMNGNNNNNATAYLQNNNVAVAAAAAAAVAATQQAAQVRMAQAQARATVANMLQQQQVAAAVQQQRAREGQQQALNNAAIAALHRAAAENQNARMQQQQQQQTGGNPAVQQQQQQLTMAAAAQIVQSYQQAQAQQAEQMRRAQALKQAHALAQAQQQAGGVPTPQSIQAMFKQAQLQDALAAANQAQAQQQQRGGGGGGAIPQGNVYPFSQAQQAQAQAHAHQQAQAQAHIMQAQAAQMQAQARQNMAALANLTPAQLQALGTNPALAHALLQARAAAQAGQQQAQAQAVAQQQQQQQQAQAAAVQQANEAAMRLRAQQQQLQQLGGGQMGGIPIPDNISPVSSNSGSPPNGGGGGNMSKEQRRMALACVALQLAHSGLSVDQAIHSGIMGGMSVTDVRFIVEVYNAELARMKDAGGVAEGPPRGGGVNGGGMEGGRQPLASFGSSELSGMPVPHPRHAPLSGASRHTSAGSPGPSSSYAGSDAGNSAPSRSRGGSVVGSAADLMHADPFGEDAAAAAAPGAPFNAFTYGFFGEPASGGGGDGVPGELLGELEGGLGPEGDSELAWVQEEDTHPQAEDQDESLPSIGLSKRDDVAERLANLDLGYGFF